MHPLSVKSIIIVIHILGIVFLYFLGLGFPELDAPPPLWVRLATLGWAMIGLLTVLGIFLRRRWAAWFGITFYLLIAYHFGKIAHNILSERHPDDGYSLLGILLLMQLLVFPILLFYKRERASVEQVPAADASMVGR